MLAARDQENLVHGHHAAAAAKPLNQGIKQLAPKTPGNRPAKTPLKVPLNDENGTNIFGGGKKTIGKGNENAIFGPSKGGKAESKAFVTPMGTNHLIATKEAFRITILIALATGNRNRAPLGAKTTNAKTKAFHIPAPAPIDVGQGKTVQKSVSARKPKPKVSHPESTKLEDILADKEALADREIEYMPPNPRDLPDFPDDYYAVDLSVLQGPHKTAGWMESFRDHEGLTYFERKEMEEKTLYDWLDKKQMADNQLAIDSRPVSCLCDPECWEGECKQSIAQRKKAQETYKQTIAVIGANPPGSEKESIKAKGPTMGTSKAAAAALSHPKRSALSTKAPGNPTAQAKKSTPLFLRGKKTPAPTNPSSMRHNAAIAASKTTLGYSKGRATSATMRKTVLPGKENEVPEVTRNYGFAPAEFIRRYGVPKYGSEKWVECKMAGCFDPDDEDRVKAVKKEEDDLGESIKANDDAIADYFREEAEKDFVLEF
ncbi:MAG: hypothetical protein Q9174_003397 [Haloplaca sp. 1 TL-2023]